MGDVFGLDKKFYSIVENDGCINLMKGAIAVADKVTTVSPTYAEELKYPEFSYGMHYILNRNAYKFFGILNGIDYTYYDPSKDLSIPFRYSAKKPADKVKNKTALQEELGLTVGEEKPLIAVISRLADQKGIDLIAGIIEDVLITAMPSLLFSEKANTVTKNFSRGSAITDPNK